MKKFYYYAKLNDNNICTEIVSRVGKLTNVTGYVEIPEYNETLRYKKYDPVTQWSQESYEPSIDTVIQDKLIELEGTNATLINQIKGLEGTIMELTAMIASLQGGN